MGVGVAGSVVFVCACIGACVECVHLCVCVLACRRVAVHAFVPLSKSIFIPKAKEQ